MKRTSEEAALDASPQARSTVRLDSRLPQLGEQGSPGFHSSFNGEGSANEIASLQQAIPRISRKIKACASCRKQKVRCLMDASGPPCRRCEEKDLSCVLNKSLQTLINERLPSTDTLLQDLETIHSGVQRALQALDLPPVRPLRSSKFTASATSHTPHSADTTFLGDDGPSCDSSPNLSPEHDDDLPDVPIHSVYHLTKLRALRGPESSSDAVRPGDLADDGLRGHMPNDLISQGLVTLEDAERLFHLFTTSLDHYMYGVGSRYKTLSALRRNSPILAAAILTVAAMHDPGSNKIYPLFNREFRRLMTASLFDRRVDRDHLRALGIASYWLHDTAWMMSGIASRRAAECDVMSHYRELGAAENSENAADFVRIWYVIYICDQHLATLYGRQSARRVDAAIEGWEALISRAGATVGDERLVSQVALLTIIRDIRELLGSDTDRPVPAVFSAQIRGFASQLDQWVGRWTTQFPEVQQGFGAFPRKGAQFHFFFAKLYLYSHVFRGIRNSTVAPHFYQEARGAVFAATSILEMIINDPDVRAALVGLPCYVQSMIGFACMFLAKLTSSVHGRELVEREIVTDLVSRLVVVYRGTPVGKWHLVHLMADGLEKMIAILEGEAGVRAREMQQWPREHANDDNYVDMGVQLDMIMNLDSQLMMDIGIGLGPSYAFMGGDFMGFDEHHSSM
ncbi:uncharacterized protein DNG_09878 [Cephalotrichum gorgonifer]|uniref:Zn(2)-C6 fungal-type domain-containing protein n=1 Tax=Cephalotrichum gorgonifer TaxID=2041049 RepID=A0AAE8SZQ0_9PEZI|nr:uncharacterized protein DNG_09878 [Cephalotrichum gorgonifer]